MTVTAVATGCGGGRRTLTLAPTTSTPAVAGTSVVRTTAPVSTAKPRATTTTVAKSTTTTEADGASSTAPAADRCAAQANDPRRVAQPTFPSGLVATSAEQRARLSYPTPWKVDQVTVTAAQLLPAVLVSELGLSADTKLRPLAVRGPTEYPGVALVRLGALKRDLASVTAAMRMFVRERGFVVRPGVVSGCLDREPAVGIVATNPTTIDVLWFAVHDDAFYLVVCLGLHDGSARSQADLLAEFEAVLETVRWTA